MKSSPFLIYFAGVGTVVVALTVGFGGGLFLTTTSVVKESPAASAARLERLRTANLEKSEPAKAAAGEAAPAPSATPLLAATTQVPVDVKAPTSAAVETAPSRAQPSAQASAVQGPAPYEGADNAIEIKLPKKPIAERPKGEPKRQAAQRKTREVIAQSSEDDATGNQPARSYRVVQESRVDREMADDRDMRIVRSYETRSRGFGRIFSDSDDD